MIKRRKWTRVHLTQLATQTDAALAGFCVWQSDRRELILPLVRGLGTANPSLEGWKLVAPSKRTGELETISYHTCSPHPVGAAEHMAEALERAKRAARERRR